MNKNLIRVRSYGMMSRRQFGAGASALGALAGTGLAASTASAEVEITFLGWQGYDAPLLVDEDRKSVV